MLASYNAIVYHIMLSMLIREVKVLQVTKIEIISKYYATRVKIQALQYGSYPQIIATRALK